MNLFQKLFHKDDMEKRKEELEKPAQEQKKPGEGMVLDSKPKTFDATEEAKYEIVEKEILPEKMICPDCGGITLVGLDFCDKCGGELINHDY